MSKDELIYLLRNDVDRFNQYREDNPDQEIDLTEADLFGANLFGVNLSRADLSRANLREVNLREANLFEANLREVNLFEANVCDANFSWSCLHGANIRGMKASFRDREAIMLVLGISWSY